MILNLGSFTWRLLVDLMHPEFRNEVEEDREITDLLAMAKW